MTSAVPAAGEQYKRVSKIGSGGFGTVYLAEDAAGRKYAVKKVNIGQARHGVDLSAVREVRALRDIGNLRRAARERREQQGQEQGQEKEEDWEHVVELVDVFLRNGAVNIVYEYVPHCLTELYSDAAGVLPRATLRRVMAQLLRALRYLHDVCFVVHRDIKPENVLYELRDGAPVVRLIDFGSSRALPGAGVRADDVAMTPQVVTLWYRPPELLLGARAYGPAVDLWGAGCILAEMFLRRPLFPAATNSELAQLDLILVKALQVAHLVTPFNIEGVALHHAAIAEHARRALGETLRAMDPAAFDATATLLSVYPPDRTTADAVLAMDFFRDSDDDAMT